MCIFCGAVATQDRVKCQNCVDKGKNNRNKQAKAKAGTGVCCNYGCNNKTETNNNYCNRCNKKASSRTTKRRTSRLGLNLCSQCGINTRSGKSVRCKDCNIKLKISLSSLKEKREVMGVCIRCGLQPVASKGHKNCWDCVKAHRKSHADLKILIVNAYGGPVCVGCGETEMCCLQMDHINGGGGKHAKEIGGRGKMYRWLRDNDFPPGFRVLCANCNIRAARGVTFPNEIKS